MAMLRIQSRLFHRPSFSLAEQQEWTRRNTMTVRVRLKLFHLSTLLRLLAPIHHSAASAAAFHSPCCLQRDVRILQVDDGAVRSESYAHFF
jgi:hypothetical protein